jgi:hypothetical protein
LGIDDIARLFEEAMRGLFDSPLTKRIILTAETIQLEYMMDKSSGVCEAMVDAMEKTHQVPGLKSDEFSTVSQTLPVL